jgi:hypothetical protein
MSFLNFRRDGSHKRKRPRTSVRLQLEALESRTVPYAVSGGAWPSPQLVTISFVPDGTDEGGPTSNLFATFNARFGSATTWENVILKAAQTWASYTNLNFAVVSDNGTPSGGGNYQQGDPGMGDIRISGYNFGQSTALAGAYQPPPVNNFSLAGDIDFNTAQPFNINGEDYDLYTVALHEFGHALGLMHSTDINAVMYPYYGGLVTDLGVDDAAGIQSIYSGGNGRSPDAYDAAASNDTMATASDITSKINATSLTAVLTGLDVTTTADVDYYKFTAPANASTSMAVTVQSSGLSLLAPSLNIYNASGTLLGSATGSGEFGAKLTKSVSITPGQTYYVRVAGANTTVFGTGAYALTLNLGTGPNPTVPLPNTMLLNGNPIQAGGGTPDSVGGHGHRHGHHGNLPLPDFYEIQPGAGGKDHLQAVPGGQTGPAAQASGAPVLAPSGQHLSADSGAGRHAGEARAALSHDQAADLGLAHAPETARATAALDAVFSDPNRIDW